MDVGGKLSPELTRKKPELEAGNRTKEFLDVQQKYFDAGKDLDHKLKEAINVQLDKLLFKS